VTGKLLDVARNRQQPGGLLGALAGRGREGPPVYNPQAPLLDRLRAAAGHVGQEFVPGTYSSLRRLEMGLAGVPEQQSGRSYDPTQEAVANLTGQRVQALDLDRSLAQKAKDFAHAKAEAAQLLTGPMRAKGVVSAADLAAARAAEEEGRRRVFEDFRADVLAAEKLGMTRAQVVRILRAGGVSKADRNALITGRYHPLQPTLPKGVSPQEGRARIGAVRAAGIR